jgi:hypothetical protein
MEETIARFGKVLGAKEIQISGRDVRFAVDGSQGGRLRVSFEGDQQRFMAVLTDAAGVTRSTVDVAPVTRIDEDVRRAPGRVNIHVGRVLIHIDSQPTLAIEIESDETRTRR